MIFTIVCFPADLQHDFTTLIVMLIGLLQSGILSIMQLLVFAVHW